MEENKMEKNKKKLKVVGIPIMLFVIGILVIGGASAAIVGYLSNTSKVNVEVNSPVVLEVSEDGITWEEGNPAEISFEGIFGGESITFFARDTNLANIDITGSSTKLVTCDVGLTCEDFASVVVTTTSMINGEMENDPAQPNPSGPHNLIEYGLCKVIDAETVSFSYGATPSTLIVGQEDTSEITVTFKPDAVGNYVFTMQKTI